jgi:hypothetical protein
MAKRKIDPARQASRALLDARAKAVGGDIEVIVDDTLTGADVFFYNEFPRRSFGGFGGTVLYDIVTRSAADHDEHCVLERLEGEGMAFSRIEMDASGTYNVVGYLLAGSDAETHASFVREAVEYTLQAAASPLLDTVLALQELKDFPSEEVTTMARKLLSDESLSAAAAATRE